jgi:hypothetical protein
VIRLFAKNLDHPSFQESQIRFNPASTKAFDTDYDGRFLPGYAPLFHSHSDSEKLAVNSLPLPDSGLDIPFSFVKNPGSRFRIEVVFSGDSVPGLLLIDKQTGAEQDLLKDPDYAFTSDEGDPPERFTIRVQRPGEGRRPYGEAGVFASGNGVVIYHSGAIRAEIFSADGRRLRVYDLSGEGEERLLPEVPSGLYVVRLSSGGSVKVAKVIIKSFYM